MNIFEKIYRSWFFRVLYGAGLVLALIMLGYDGHDFLNRPTFERSKLLMDVIWIGLSVLYFVGLRYIKHKTTLKIVMSVVFGGYILLALYIHFTT